MIDTLLSEISAEGWLLNNCYQIDSSLWRVNLRKPAEDGDYFTDWAEGPTFADALEDCISKLTSAEYFESSPTSFASTASPLPLTAQSLLTSLGLLKPINRRA